MHLPHANRWCSLVIAAHLFPDRIRMQRHLKVVKLTLERVHVQAVKTLTTQAVVKALVKAHARENPDVPQPVAIRLCCARLVSGAKVIFSHSKVLLAIATPAEVACMRWQDRITRDSVKSQSTSTELMQLLRQLSRQIIPLVHVP